MAFFRTLSVFVVVIIAALTVALPEQTKDAPTTPPNITIASTTPQSSPTFTTTSDKPEQTTETGTTKKPPLTPSKKPAVTTTTPTTNTAPPATSTTTLPPVVAATTPSLAQTNEVVRKAVVNILCRAQNQAITGASGSGVIIDPQGIILTNAHLAQYFLLQDYPTKNSIVCSIRTGSPAYPLFRAEVLFISPQWIQDNAAMINDQNPTGTGQNDYALLRITGRIDGTPLQENFPFLPLEEDEEVSIIDAPIVIAGYPAGFLGSIAIERDLYLYSSISTIKDIYTFSQDNTKDMISIGGTIIAQKGASGGAVSSKDGTLLGVIVTTTISSTTEARDLRAITTGHIQRSFKKEEGASLQTLLKSDIAGSAKNFNDRIAPILQSILVREIER